MPSGIVTVAGGLPLWAEVWFSGPDYFGEYDCGVDSLHWIRWRKGKAPAKGAEISQAVYDKIEKTDAYWQASVTEQVSEQLAYEQADRDRERIQFS